MTLHRAGRVPIHPDAFSYDGRTRAKHPRSHDRDHLKFIRGLPCLVCGIRNNIQAAHLRSPNAIYAKRATGMGEKPHDKWCLPLCPAHHEEQHKGSEVEFWKRHGICDPWAIALRLYAHTQDEEAAELVITMERTNGAPK